MKHVLHWVSHFIVCGAALPIYEAHGGWAYGAAIAVIWVALILQYIEGRLARGVEIDQREHA